MLIRRMTIEDIRDSVEIEQQCFSQPWSEKSFCDSLLREDTIFLVSELLKENTLDHTQAMLESESNLSVNSQEIIKQNKVVGYIGMYLSFDEASITNVAVLPQYRKMGIGEQLVANAKVFAKEAGAEMIFLEVRTSNIPAISLYEKMGFEQLGVRKNFYDHPLEDAYIMCCRL